MEEKDLQAKLEELGTALEVPGVSVGLYHDGAEHYAFHGVTSVENPLPVDADTLFQFGSTGKTFTATAIMRLVEQGKVALDAPVRTYLPDFKTKDPSVAEKVTVLQLLNHSAGWSGDLMEDTGDGDDALDKYVAKIADVEQVTPLGSVVSYNNASLSVAGQIIARTQGTTYEQALKDLLFDPLGLDHTFFFMTDIMTRRFAAGHRQDPDGSIHVARPWALPRGNAPAGGISANAGDQIKWARFHLGDGKGVDGSTVLSRELLDLMKQPTMEMKGSALGDYVGISWLIRDIDGVRLVGHGGTTNGHHSDFAMVPEKDFAIALLTNCAPNGPQLMEELFRWALESYIGVIDKDPEAVLLGDEALQQYTGTYETIAAKASITAREGWLWAQVEMKPEMAALLREQGEEVPEQPPVPLGLLAGDGDRYIVPDGPAKGMKGYFVRGAAGEIEAVHLGGRLATRTSKAVTPSP
ncbi:MAG: beta-lactamase family protein [Actinobacteria bacterium]|nr:beta-lactamase family protein [Actinomycetota bacterium]MBV9255687.1 beta-lactamase family protein [Actinomycetota bacterium]